MGMYTNAIKAEVGIKSPTDRVSKPVSSPVRGHPQRNSKGSSRPQANSKGSNHPQARATGPCNSRIKIGARELRTITVHNSIEAAVRADQAVPVDPVEAAEVAADEGKQLRADT